MPTGSIVYDTGALLAAERRRPDVWELHTAAVKAGVRLIVPVVVLAQAWRGGPQANLSRFLAGCAITPDTESVGRTAGELCRAAGSSDVVDAVVTVVAARHGSLIVTTDPKDITHLIGSLSFDLKVHAL